MFEVFYSSMQIMQQHLLTSSFVFLLLCLYIPVVSGLLPNGRENFLLYSQTAFKQ